MVNGTLSREIPTFKVSEYNALRAEIVAHIEAIRAIETETVLGLGAVGAWVLTQSQLHSNIKLAVCVVAFCFWFLNYARYQDRKARIDRISAYLKAIEKSYGNRPYPIKFREKDYWANGWEQFHGSTWSDYEHTIPRIIKTRRNMIIAKIAVEMYFKGVWISMFVFVIIFAIIVGFFLPGEKRPIANTNIVCSVSTLG